KEPNPYAALQWISGQNTGVIFMSQRCPGNLLHLAVTIQFKKTELLVVDPKISSFVLNYGKHSSAARNAAYRIKAVILKVADAAKCGDPDSPAIILKKGTRAMAVEFAVGVAAAGAGNRDLTVIPSVQAARSCEPNASVPICQNGLHMIVRRPLFHS